MVLQFICYNCSFKPKYFLYKGSESFKISDFFLENGEIVFFGEVLLGIEFYSTMCNEKVLNPIISLNKKIIKEESREKITKC